MMQPAVVQWHNEALGNVDDFLRDNDKFVWHIARKFERSGKVNGLDLDELHSIAQLGMLKAYQKFDDSFGFQWTTLAAKCITQQLLHALRDSKRKLHTVSLDAVLTIDGTGNEFTIADTVTGESDIDISESWFWEYASALSEREQLILQLRLDGLNQRDIGERIGVKQSIVSRILRRIKHEYEKGEWKMTQINMTKEEYLAERLAGKNRAQIANDLGLKQQAYLYPQLEKWGIKDKGAEQAALAELTRPVRTQTAVTVEPQEPPKVVSVELTKPVAPPAKQEKSVSVLERLDKLRNKFAECIAELAEIEKEVRTLLEVKSEMSEVAKKLLELVG